MNVYRPIDSTMCTSDIEVSPFANDSTGPTTVSVSSLEVAQHTDGQLTHNIFEQRYLRLDLQ